MPAATAGPLQRTVSIGLKYFAHDAEVDRRRRLAQDRLPAPLLTLGLALALELGGLLAGELLHVPVLKGFSSPELPALEKIRP